MLVDCERRPFGIDLGLTDRFLGEVCVEADVFGCYVDVAL